MKCCRINSCTGCTRRGTRTEEKKTGNTSASTVGVLANNLRTPDEKKNPAFNASDWEELREDG